MTALNDMVVDMNGGEQDGGRSLPYIDSDGGYLNGPHEETLGGVPIKPLSDSQSQNQTGGGVTATKVRSGVGGFFNYMFNFDQKTKCDLLNLAQYSIVGLIPVIMMLKLIKNYFPSADESKGSFELTAECTLEIVFILFCIYFIHRFICYIPTYSGMKYEGVNFTQSLLMFLVILLTIQTKLGTKLNILVRRVSNVVEGYSSYGGDTGVDSMDATSEMMNSLEAKITGPAMSQTETSFGPQAPIVPSGGPGLPPRRQQPPQAQAAPQGELAAANDGFSSGGLSGSAW